MVFINLSNSLYDNYKQLKSISILFKSNKLSMRLFIVSEVAEVIYGLSVAGRHNERILRFLLKRVYKDCITNLSSAFSDFERSSLIS